MLQIVQLWQMLWSCNCGAVLYDHQQPALYSALPEIGQCLGCDAGVTTAAVVHESNHTTVISEYSLRQRS
jgi:hypothetical protein